MNTLQDAIIGYRAQQALMQQMVARSSWIQPRDRNTTDGTVMVALALAAFMQYTVGHTAEGEPFVLEDPLAEVPNPNPNPNPSPNPNPNPNPNPSGGA